MIVAIVNPTSANKKTGKAWTAMQSVLESRLGKLEVLQTEARLHAVELTRKALKMGAEIIIAVGGDGTVNEVVNGFFELHQPINPAAKLAVIMQGTGGDFARSCELPDRLEQIACGILNGAPQLCDVVRMTLEPMHSPLRERYFINVADIGVGGLVVDIVNHCSSKLLGGTLSFFLAGLRASLLEYKNAPMQIELDGQVIADHTPHYFVAVANGRYFGSRMHIAPEAVLNDGLFDVVLIGDLTIPQKFYFASKLYRGKVHEVMKTKFFRGKRLSITSSTKVLIEADGELVGSTDATFEMIPAAIQLVGCRLSHRVTEPQRI